MIFTHILFFATYANCLEWIKLSPMKREFMVTENILSYLAPDKGDETFIRLSDPIFSTKYDNVTLTTVRPIMLSVEKFKYENVTYKQKLDNITIGGFSFANKNVNDAKSDLVKSSDERATTEESKILKDNVKFINNSVDDPFTLKKLTPLLKNLQINLFTKIPVAFSEKTKLLQSIHDDILIHIDNAIKSLWPSKRIRNKRGTKDSDNHLDFPSSETALMTISFLTFAVYLIKLVLQVVTIFKNKKGMMYTPMVTGTGKGFP